MPTNPKTGTISPLVMSTMFLFWKLTEAGKHLQDFTGNSLAFGDLLARRLDLVERLEMTPLDFAREWKGAMDAIDREIAVDYLYLGDNNPVAYRAVAKKLEVRDIGERMRWMFAEDLCGKEFADAVAACAEEDINLAAYFIYTIKPRQTFEEWSRSAPGKDLLEKAEDHGGCHADDVSLAEQISMFESHCHSFPPEPSVVEESAKRPWVSDDDRLSDVERIPPPPGHEFHNDSWDA